MSSTIPIYIVSEDELKSSAGSRRLSLIDEVANRYGEQSLDLGASLTKLDVLKAFFGRPPLKRALHDIVFGKVGGTLDPVLYANAYHLLSMKYSFDYFEDWIQVGRAGQWLDRMREAAKTLSLRLDFDKLFFGGAMIDIPYPDPEIANFGYWSAADVRAHKMALERYRASELYETDQDPMRELNYPLHDIYRWLERASGQTDGAIVAFYY